MNQFEIKETRIEFFINNFIVQSNISRKTLIQKWNKYANIEDLTFCKINDIAPNFYLVLSEAYSEPSHTSKMERFAKIANG